jgi:lincosamide nucleotidyltransferase A/C/D/E
VVAVRYLTRLQESYNGTFCNLPVTQRDEISTPVTPPEGPEGTRARDRISIADANSSPRGLTRFPSSFAGGSAGMIGGSVCAVMSADDVLAVLALFRAARVDVWVGGGWGIDALVGRETRPHRDLDLMHRVEQEPTMMAALAAAEFAQTLDWRPVRFAVTDPAGREIDLHPLTFAPDGSAVQASLEPDRPFTYPARCFVTGRIGGAVIPCLSAEQQVYFHQGYEPKDRDRHDMAQLRGAFGLDTHF